MFSVIILFVLILIVNTDRYRTWSLEFKVKRLLARIHTIHLTHRGITNRAIFKNFELEYNSYTFSYPLLIRVRRPNDIPTLIATYTSSKGITWEHRPPYLVMQMLESTLRGYYHQLQSEHASITMDVFKDIIK